MSPGLQQQVDRAGRYAAIALGFSIPVSVALDNVLLVAALLCWAAGGAYRDKWEIVKRNGVAHAALLLFALLVAGTVYGPGTADDARQYLGKYLDLALIPVFLHFFRDAPARRQGLHALAASLALVLALSCLLKLGAIPGSFQPPANAGSAAVFKLRLTHNILMAFGAFLFAWLALDAADRRWKAAWWVMAALAAANVLLMVGGATGYVMLAGLALLLGHSRCGWRGAGASALIVAVAVAALLALPGPFQQRAKGIFAEAVQWNAGVASSTSAGLRLEFYRNTTDIIVRNPVAGVGTGGFPAAYAEQVRGTGMAESRNPHNEFLHITVQLGIVGLAALLWLFVRQWQIAANLPARIESQLARGLVTAIVIGSAFNSLLLDHTEGLLFAWLTGLLFAGVQSAAATGPGTQPMRT